MNKKMTVIFIISAFLIAGLFFWLGRQAGRKPETAKKKAVNTAQAAAKPAPRAKVAVVMDDFGYNMNNVDTLFAIKEPVTLSVLPGLKYSSRVADYAGRRGYEVILHLPLEPRRKDVKEEIDTIKSGMTGEEIALKFAKELETVPGATGVSNHMGSKSTEDKELMAAIFKNMKKRNLYFFDSLTSEKSVCREVAREAGLKYARRDIFLDNTDKEEYVAKQLAALEKLALKRGRAIAICHDRKNTIAALAKKMPEMAKNGIEFVFLSEMVR